MTALDAHFLAIGSHAASVADDSNEIACARVVPMALSATCNPASIQTGISCGMADMCGLDPCLCGAADEWGCCACSGTETTYPAVTYASSDESVVRVVEAFDRTWLVPTGAGTATITCTASLVHHVASPTTFQVRVAGPTTADALAAALVVVALAVIVGIIVLVKRAATRPKSANPKGDHGDQE